MVSTNMVRLRGVGMKFAGRTILDGLDLDLAPGERFGLIGPAASGKSVLTKLICGLLKPEVGEVTLAGDRVDPQDEVSLEKIRARIGMLFQNNALFDFMNVGENIAFPLKRQGQLPDAEIRDRVAQRLRAVGLAGSEEKFPNQLSGGMKKRVALARALIARPPLCIYDEPTAGLDPVTTSKIYDLLAAEQEASGATVFVISSDVDALMRFSPRMAMLYRGKLLYDGSTREMVDSPDPVVRQFVNGLLEGPL